MKFPPLLPALEDAAGFSASEANNVIRTRMDAGPAKVRRRSTAGPTLRRMSHPAYNKAELRTFLQFFREDTAHGSRAFQMADPVTDEMISCRFVDPPNWSAIGGGMFSVSVSLEVMP